MCVHVTYYTDAACATDTEHAYVLNQENLFLKETC